MRMKKHQWLCALLSLAFLHCSYAASTQKATFYVDKPYKQVREMIRANLQRCTTKQAGFFNSGRELTNIDLGNAIIYHVNENQITDEIIGDLGKVAISRDHGKTVIEVTNQPSFIGKDLHLIESVRNWVKGNNKCVPNTGGILS